MTTPNGHDDKRWVVAGLSVLLVIVVLGGLVARTLGESARIQAANEAQDRRIAENLTKIEADVRADCQFKLDIIKLPSQTARNGQPVSEVLLTLARDAREAFIGKGCPMAMNDRTGRPYGEPPEVSK